MSDIWINQRHARLKSYSATTTGAKSVVTIKIEVSEHSALGYLLKELGDIEREQTAAARKAKEDAAAAKRKKPPALPAPLLGLPYYPEQDE